jgi:Skp family chaperone for outer membrane proteins
MFMKKLLAALVFVGFLTGGAAAPIGIHFDSGNVTVSKAAKAQTAKPEDEKKGKKDKKAKKEKKPKKEKKAKPEKGKGKKEKGKGAEKGKKTES